jgi:hypothetical protein
VRGGIPVNGSRVLGVQLAQRQHVWIARALSGRKVSRSCIPLRDEIEIRTRPVWTPS